MSGPWGLTQGGGPPECGNLAKAWPHGITIVHHGGMNWREVITADPDVVQGQVRFKGTRVPVSVVLDCLAAGLSEDQILDEYPTLPALAVRAALAYAAELAHDDILPLAAAQ